MYLLSKKNKQKIQKCACLDIIFKVMVEVKLRVIINQIGRIVKLLNLTFFPKHIPIISRYPDFFVLSSNVNSRSSLKSYFSVKFYVLFKSAIKNGFHLKNVPVLDISFKVLVKVKLKFMTKQLEKNH